MKNQKIGTLLGIIIIVIFSITVGVFVWKVEKNREAAEQSQNVVSVNNPAVPQASMNNQQERPSIAPEEFPTIPAEPGMSMEEIIKQAAYKLYPDWKRNNYTITVTIEISEENHAIGRFVFDGYNVVKDGTYHSTGERVWFAAKSGESWTLVETTGAGYWGSCQNFKKYNFPASMTPDCWDMDRNILVDTSNPKKFYPDGFTKADKKALVQAFVSFIRKQKDSGVWEHDSYLQKDVYVKIDKKIGNYVIGTMLIGGSQNISAPYFLAINENKEWIVVHNGQDKPKCGDIEPYNFPHEIIDQCYDDQSKSFKDVF